MPYVEGESLRERLAPAGRAAGRRGHADLREVVDALADAHGTAWCTATSSRTTCMLSGRHALVTDFGVAKAVSEASRAAQHRIDHRAASRSAPGVHGAGAGDGRSARSITGWTSTPSASWATRCSTGTPPFTGRSPQEILAAQVTQAPEPITLRRAAVSPALAAVIMKCLEKHAADRWQTAPRCWNSSKR